MRFQIKLLASFCLVVCLSSPAFSGQWSKQSSGTLAWLHAVYFLDANQGWIAGSNGTLLTTKDGGASWKAAEKPSEDNLRDIFFTDARNGWLLCERDITKLKSQADTRSYLMRTSDGGATWERTGFFGDDRSSAQITRFIVSSDRKNAWAVGEVGSLYALENESIWRKQASPTRYLLRGGAFFNEREGFVIGAGATLLGTNDGGRIWRSPALFNGENARFNSIFFATRTLGWAVGAAGKIFATTDGGKTWRLQSSPTEADLFAVRFVSPNEGWAVGDGGVLLHTTTSGTTWKQIETNASHRLESIFLVGRERGFAVGFGGTILSYNSEPAMPRPRLTKTF
ncbi:MAG TPA: YCF48-related protein [Pyrinomonadaceae bacterium]|nr:YCF48-related protein [Pyrinomonadaceae bacterium]